jgi:deoxyribodipyrimidine photo-lyase
MEQCIDGELASNDGGWQWSASTGCDPQPYFRIFNPYSQSLKVMPPTYSQISRGVELTLQADPTGDFIRAFVPELASLRGDGRYLHNQVTDPRSSYLTL